METLQERNLEGAETDCLSVPKDELVRKMSGLKGHGAFSRNSGRKECASTLQRGAATQEVFKDVVRSCRKKIREVTAQLSLNLATYVKDNQNYFLNTLMEKEREGELPFLFGEDVVTKDEDKDEALNSFFTSVFNNKTGWPQDKCSPELVDGDREKNTIYTTLSFPERFSAPLLSGVLGSGILLLCGLAPEPSVQH